MHAVELRTTVADAADAHVLAEALLATKQAACVKLIPGVSSQYWWHGAREEATEVVVVALTDPAHAHAAATLLRDHHPYHVPEIVAVEVEVLDPAYGAWLTETLEVPGDAATGG